MAAVASVGFVACTVTTDSSGTSSSSDGGTKSETSTSTGDGSTTTGDGGGGGDSGGSCVLGADLGSAACDNCATSKCCAVVNACVDDNDCIELNNCAQACLDADAGSGDAGSAVATCVADCKTAHAASVTKFEASNNCLVTNCSAQCN